MGAEGRPLAAAYDFGLFFFNVFFHLIIFRFGIYGRLFLFSSVACPGVNVRRLDLPRISSRPGLEFGYSVGSRLT